MKVYCVEKGCKNSTEGYAICTALMDVTECPKRKVDKEEKEAKENGEK
jgi:hypothetical protein